MAHVQRCRVISPRSLLYTWMLGDVRICFARMFRFFSGGLVHKTTQTWFDTAAERCCAEVL